MTQSLESELFGISESKCQVQHLLFLSLSSDVKALPIICKQLAKSSEETFSKCLAF